MNNPTPEFFDPGKPHIGFSGTDFDPPSSVRAGQTPALEGAGKALGERLVVTDTIVAIIKDLTGVDLSGLFDTVGDLIADGVATLERIVNQIMDIINGLIITPINSALQGVKDWFAGLLGFRSKTTTDVADAQAQGQNNGVVVREIANNIEQKVWMPDIPLVQPYSRSLNPYDDPSFDYMLLFQRGGSVATSVGSPGSTGGSFAGGDFHSHTIGNVTVSATFTPEVPFVTPAKDTLVGSVIRVPYTRTHDLLSCIVDDVTGPCALYLTFRKLNADGDLVLIHETENLTPWIPPQRHVLRVTIPEIVQQLVHQGDTVSVDIRQSGSGTVRRIAGLTMPNIPAPPLVHPPSAGWTFASGASAPTSVLKAQQNYTGTTFTPWVAAGHNVTVPAPPFIVWQDSFDGPNGSLSSGWYGNIASIKRRSGHAVWDSAGNGAGHALQAKKLNYDNGAVEAYLGEVSNSVKSYLIARASTDYASRASVGFSDSETQVLLNGTVVKTEPVGWSQNDKIRFEFEDHTYRVLKNNAVVLETTNSSGPIGFTNRTVGFALQRAAFVYRSPDLATFLAEDLRPA